MPLPKSLTTVTRFSKYLALSLFIICPIISFYLGIYYQKSQQPETSSIPPVIANPEPTTAPLIANLKTYTNTQLHYSFQYPSSWILNNAINDPTAFVLHYQNVKITGGYSAQASLNVMGISYCGANLNDVTRCQTVKIGNGGTALIDWGTKDISPSQANVQILHPKGGMLLVQLTPVNAATRTTLLQILSTFKFLDQNPSPTCRPRPACLDANPRCMIAETDDMCPQASPTPSGGAVMCSMIAKQCPDGSYVGRSGPNCEFKACPTSR